MDISVLPKFNDHKRIAFKDSDERLHHKLLGKFMDDDEDDRIILRKHTIVGMVGMPLIASIANEVINKGLPKKDMFKKRIGYPAIGLTFASILAATELFSLKVCEKLGLVEESDDDHKKDSHDKDDD